MTLSQGLFLDRAPTRRCGRKKVHDALDPNGIVSPSKSVFLSVIRAQHEESRPICSNLACNDAAPNHMVCQRRGLPNVSGILKLLRCINPWRLKKRDRVSSITNSATRSHCGLYAVWQMGLIISKECLLPLRTA
jgi:hypothetical protein